ncbi:hypothetical protein E2C01_004308 [Portunus trituberculatus]|uniref:Uncharacterized protein n=1 Tax=Portunus trituberculatus TaxID=210409 RepID=A0A5B7CPK1_PORTR|nr:hypothetical protein [Portunus trituberculatus]
MFSLSLPRWAAHLSAPAPRGILPLMYTLDHSARQSATDDHLSSSSSQICFFSIGKNMSNEIQTG